MTKEDKQLLLKDLCGRLLSGVIAEVSFYPNSPIKQAITFDTLEGFDIGRLDVIPYLRSLSSMTEEEQEQFIELTNGKIYYTHIGEVGGFVDWLNVHHFDYRGLIEKGLALEAPKDMYNEE